ncbi:nuclear transport factor 2 family protein [Amycolatopsis halotolerans]|uniref:Nuclear transport factor 2 family protein n=1 Tax=Amycolatopsis halotolerans TaxID=330083 RepID=A0ABV7QM58_9PSEU
MSTTASELVQDYFEAWNTFDAEQRRKTLEAIFTEDADIVDPDWTADGREAIVDAVGQAREKLGDLALGLTQVISAHHDVALYAWYLGKETEPVAAGYGVLTFEKGRISQARNFFG